jgi:hypothetical protein
MDLIIKCPRPELDDERQCVIAVRRYRNTKPEAGDRAFLWFSETTGGEGLAGLATILGVSDANPVAMALKVSLARPTRALPIATVSPHRDDGPTTALGALSEKLYNHSHHKVASLSDLEVTFLESFFDGADLGRSHTGMPRSHPTVRRMETVVKSVDGQKAARAATDAGRPALSGVEDLLRRELGEGYFGGEPTSWAGTLVAEVMESLGYVQIGKRAMPDGSVAKTAAVFKKR